MRRSTVIILYMVLCTAVTAQNDSLKKIRFAGFQLDLAPNIYPNFRSQYQPDYRQYIKNDENLNVDLTGYKTQWAYSSGFNGIPGVKMYADINNGKKMKLELFFGLRYCQEFNTGAYYTKTNYDTLNFYTNSSGQRLYQVLSNESFYNYDLNSQKLMVPLGINFVSNKQRILWITAGLEIAPALNFNYVFRSIHMERYEEIYVHEGDSITNRYNYRNSLGYGKWSHKETKLKGTGYGFYAALPFSLYIHPFRRMRFLKHLSALASVSPVFLYTHSKYAGNAYVTNLVATTGIRYNW